MALARGLSPHVLKSCKSITDLPPEYHHIIADLLAKRSGIFVPSEFANMAMNINDAIWRATHVGHRQFVTDTEREWELIGLFEKQGIELTFTGPS